MGEPETTKEVENTKEKVASNNLLLPSNFNKNSTMNRITNPEDNPLPSARRLFTEKVLKSEERRAM